MPATQNIIGKKVGMLEVIDFFGIENNRRQWLCICDCGSFVIKSTSSFNYGASKSCGCIFLETRPTKHGFSKKGNRISEYPVWVCMKQRCLNPDNESFHNYGGRGITVCKRWESSFENFINDMGRRPSSAHTLERIDNNKGYSPSNCKWATRKEQANNNRHNLLLTYKGVTQTVSQWADQFNIPVGKLYGRIRWKFTLERMFNPGNYHRFRKEIKVMNQ